MTMKEGVFDPDNTAIRQAIKICTGKAVAAYDGDLMMSGVFYDPHTVKIASMTSDQRSRQRDERTDLGKDLEETHFAGY